MQVYTRKDIPGKRPVDKGSVLYKVSALREALVYEGTYFCTHMFTSLSTLVPLKAEPETKTCLQMIYLKSAPRSQE